jgi:effector-binding domain-containing protein
MWLICVTGLCRTVRPMKYLSWDEWRIAMLNVEGSRAQAEEGHGEDPMNYPRFFRIALVVAPIVAAALPAARAQSPAPSTPAPSATPAPPPAETKSPGDVPSTTPQSTPPAPVQAADPFGEQIALTPKTVIVTKGTANWDTAFETLLASLKTLNAELEKQGGKSTGNSMIVYTATDDTGFSYLAEIPVDQEPKNLPKTISVGKSPEGKALKFVHRGSYENMDNTYEAITNHLDDKKLEAKDTFIEEYITDPLKTQEDKLVINVYVPLK